MSSRPLPTDTREMVRRDESERAASIRQRAAAWLALLLCLPLCLGCAVFLDVPLARMALQATPHVRQVAQVFSDLGLSGYMLVLSGLIAIAAYAALRRGRFPIHEPLLSLIAERAFFVFAAVAVSGIGVQIIKHLVGRARPGLMDKFGAYHFDFFSLKASLASFPSGHSTSIFALATALGLIVPRLRLPMFGLAVLVGIARVVLASHYASDILAGAMFGTVVALWVAHAFANRSLAFTRTDGGCG